MLRLLLASLLLAAACSAPRDDAALIATSKRVFGTTPRAAVADAPVLVELGRHLYFSNELSLNRSQSCNTCHPVDGGRAGVDNQQTSEGAHGKRGRRNTPTVLNASLHLAQFWDGRAATLEEQATMPIVNPIEMAMPDDDAVAKRLRTSEAIDRRLFAAAFPDDRDPFTIRHAARAIAAFERTLHTSDRFDRFMNGDRATLTAKEKEGLQLFLDTGCASCHNGPLLGANKMMKLGLVHPYENTEDRGRAELTRRDGDEYVFKVPALRNVARTGPYFHDGRVENLPRAVERMAWHQLGRRIDLAERDAIVAFLRTLSDSSR